MLHPPHLEPQLTIPLIFCYTPLQNLPSQHPTADPEEGLDRITPVPSTTILGSPKALPPPLLPQQQSVLFRTSTPPFQQQST